MSRKRNAVLLLLALCAAVAFERSTDLLTRLSARHVRETAIVSAGGRRLGGLFEGRVADPRWSALVALGAMRSRPRCAGNRGGLLARLGSLIEPTAHAFVTCTPGACEGYYEQPQGFSCGNECSGYVAPADDPNNMCGGSYYDGSSGCNGIGGGCSGMCNLNSCDNPSCTCSADGGPCASSSDCCNSEATCIDGTCSVVEVRKQR